MSTLEQFRDEFEKWLLSRDAEGAVIEYQRPPSAYKFQA